MLAVGIHFEAAGDADLASLKLPPAIIDVIGIIGNLRVRIKAKHEGNAERHRKSCCSQHR